MWPLITVARSTVTHSGAQKFRNAVSINFVSIFLASRRPSVAQLSKMDVGGTAACCKEENSEHSWSQQQCISTTGRPFLYLCSILTLCKENWHWISTVSYSGGRNVFSGKQVLAVHAVNEMDLGLFFLSSLERLGPVSKITSSDGYAAVYLMMQRGEGGCA